MILQIVIRKHEGGVAHVNFCDELKDGWSDRKKQYVSYRRERVRVMVINATFNNISVISWQTVLLVKETRVPGENH